MRVYQGSLFGTSELCGRKLIERKYLDDVTWIDRATARYGKGLTAGFVNYYRNGSDSVAWHADRVGVHQSDPIVAI
eukprot:gene7751-2446_t